MESPTHPYPLIVRPRRAQNRVVMGTDDEDLLRSACPENLDFQIAARCARDLVFLASRRKFRRLEFGFNAARRLCQLMRAISHVAFANVNGQVDHVLA